MMHNKVMVVDGIWSTVGSINFVNRSMTKNAEANFVVYDRGFATEVEAMVLADLGALRRAHRGAVEETRALHADRRALLLPVLRELLNLARGC